MSPITTHVLDTQTGMPAANVAITLEQKSKDGWMPLAKGRTDADGRIRDLVTEASLAPGIFRMTFETGEYFQAQGVTGFYPSVSILFEIANPLQHHHIPLLLSPYGYSTYRGS